MRGTIYARFSGGEGREKSTTIEAQIEMYRQLAQADGIRLCNDTGDPRDSLTFWLLGRHMHLR